MNQYLVTLIIVGLLAGVIGHLMMKGRSPGLVITLIVGLAGAWFGNLILQQINGTLIQFLFAAGGATLLLWLVSLFKK